MRNVLKSISNHLKAAWKALPSSGGRYIEPLECRRLCAHYVNGSHSFADGNFADANWETIPVTVGSGGVSEGIREKNGGHPGAFRSVTDVVDSGSGDSEIFGFHGNLKAMYNPAAKGAITSLNYSEFNKLISGFGQGERTGPALEQNGTVYFLLDQFLITPQSTWKKTKVSNLTDADFATLDTGAHPDFSQAGSPIEFGFYRANTSGYGGYTIVAGIDDWAIKIKTRKLVP